MIQIDLNGKKYIGPEPGRWDQLKIKKAIELSKVCRAMPVSLRKYYDTFIQQDEAKRAEILDSWTDEDMMRNHPAWEGKIIECMYDIPAGTLDPTLSNINDISAFYQKYCLMFVVGIVHLPMDYVPSSIVEFRLKGYRYLMPPPFETLKQTLPMGMAGADQITEALDILNVSAKMQEGKMELLPLLVASLCLREGETYEPKKAMERSADFVELPMSVGLEVFFYCINFTMDATLSGLRSGTGVDPPGRSANLSKTLATAAALLASSGRSGKTIKN